MSLNVQKADPELKPMSWGLSLLYFGIPALGLRGAFYWLQHKRFG
jgi:hypothetical protein